MNGLSDERPQSNSVRSYMKSIAIYCFSSMAATIVISLGLYISTQLSGYNLENMYHSVDRKKCSCDCWDGYFRGIHSRGGYKTFYFNYEKQTILILGLLLFTSELLRKILLDMIQRRHITCILLIPSIYSSFYGTWCIINYLNDHDYNRMLRSQTFFWMTELITTHLFSQCLNAKNPSKIPSWWIYVLSAIASLHLFLALEELDAERMSRNVFIILSDLTVLIWMIVMRIRTYPQRPENRSICIWVSLTFTLWLLYRLFFSFRERSH